MAQFLKVPTTSAAGVVGETLIPISHIGGMVATNTGAAAAAITTLVITTDTSATSLYTVVVSAPIVAPATAATRQADMLASFSAALTANPGGVVSTVVPPLTTAQAPLAQGGGTANGRGPQGNIVVTAPAVRSTFVSAIFTP